MKSAVGKIRQPRGDAPTKATRTFSKQVQTTKTLVPLKQRLSTMLVSQQNQSFQIHCDTFFNTCFYSPIRAEGGTFTFHLQHYFNSTLESYYDNDHTIQGVLSITPTNHQVEKFSHPKNEGQDTHNSDGSVNMDYKGNLIVTVQCNDSCQCTMQEEIL